MNFNDVYDKINSLEFDFIYLRDIINQYENETNMMKLKNENEELKKELNRLKNENEELKKKCNIPNVNDNFIHNVNNNNQNISLYSLFKNRDTPMFIDDKYCFDGIRGIPLNIKLDKNNNIISMLIWNYNIGYACHFEYDDKNRLIKTISCRSLYNDSMHLYATEYNYTDNNMIFKTFNDTRYNQIDKNNIMYKRNKVIKNDFNGVSETYYEYDDDNNLISDMFIYKGNHTIDHINHYKINENKFMKYDLDQYKQKVNKYKLVIIDFNTYEYKYGSYNYNTKYVMKNKNDWIIFYNKDKKIAKINFNTLEYKHYDEHNGHRYSINTTKHLREFYSKYPN